MSFAKLTANKRLENFSPDMNELYFRLIVF